jgi:hypothetical protein
MLFSRRKFLLLGLTLLGSLPATAEEPPPLPGIRISPYKPSLAVKAGYIFSGTVKAVERLVAKNSSVEVMRITFHVDQGLRGAHTGETLVIREWAGLWQGGERYQLGERVMLFLYPPSKLGLTSPVGGSAGRFVVDSGGQVTVEPGKVGYPRARLSGKLRMPPLVFFRALRHGWEGWP